MTYNAVLDIKYNADPLNSGVAYPEPVTLAEAKEFLRISNVTEDTLITTLIKAAVRKVEGMSGLFLRPRNVTVIVRNELGGFELPGPFVNLSTLVWKDADGVTITDTLYTVPGMFSSVRDGYDNPIQHFTFDAGYGIGTTVPDDLKVAVMQLVSFLYFNRGDNDKQGKIPDIIKILVYPYKRLWI